MSIELQLSSVFARYAGNQTIVTVEGSTVGECLDDLFRQFPDFRKIFLDKEGKLTRAYDIYINGASAYPKEMNKSIRDGDRLHIVPIIYGG
jgi:molybdopterin converting factor small subunit